MFPIFLPAVMCFAFIYALSSWSIATIFVLISYLLEQLKVRKIELNFTSIYSISTIHHFFV